MADFTHIKPGFADPVHQAQACFRTILDAMAHPGRIVMVPPPAGLAVGPLGAAACAVALTLCDFDTPVWFDAAAQPAAPYVTFHCGAPLTAEPAAARFGFAGEPAALPALHTFALGTDEYPERSTTLLIEVAGLRLGNGGVRIAGPGIVDTAGIVIDGLPARFWTDRAALAELFPRGVDVLFASGKRLAALPRSTRVQF
ncbi:MAG: phosphonate C-P lyase system protein PhnH [Alphaproteobacteria bacterium]|nr:phosphonate C-P lyase system protein PhnH [Alphaproteobacteria bacterium]